MVTVTIPLEWILRSSTRLDSPSPGYADGAQVLGTFLKLYLPLASSR